MEFVGSYRLIYRIDPEAVFVLAVIHGARELQHYGREKIGDPIEAVAVYLVSAGFDVDNTCLHHPPQRGARLHAR